MMVRHCDVDNVATAACHAAMPGHIDRARTARLLAAAGLDALLVAAPETFLWATGAPAGVAMGWRRIGPALAVVPADPARPVGAVVTDLFAADAEAAGCAPLRVHAIWPGAGFHATPAGISGTGSAPRSGRRNGPTPPPTATRCWNPAW
jgi:hypothetical protein